MAALDPDTELTPLVDGLLEEDWVGLFSDNSSAALGQVLGALLGTVKRLSDQVDNLYEVVAELGAKLDGME